MTAAATAGAAGSTARGIAWGLVAFFAMAVSDALAKHLVERLPLFEVLLLRSVVILALLLPFMRLRGLVLSTRRLGLQLLRGVFLLGAAGTFYIALRHLSLAEATTLAFIAPLLTTALAPAITGDRVHAASWGPVLLGFAGVLVVLQPGTELFRWPALWPLLCALCYALVMLLGRRLSTEVPLVSLLGWAVLVSIGLSAPFAVAEWVTPDLGQLLELLLFGGVTMAMQYLLLLAYQHAPAPVIAPLDYTVLLWALAFGWLFWDEVPALRLLPGAVLIIAAGLLVARRGLRRGARQPVAGDG